MSMMATSLPTLLAFSSTSNRHACRDVRCPPLSSQILAGLVNYGINQLFIIGGDGTHRAAQIISKTANERSRLPPTPTQRSCLYAGLSNPDFHSGPFGLVCLFFSG